MSRFTLALAVVLVLLAPSGDAIGDCYLKTRITSSGLAGFGGTEGETEIWLKGKRQAERTKMEMTGALVGAFTGETRTRTITDLERGVVITVDENEKTYTELTFEQMRAQLEESREQMANAFRNAGQGGERGVPEADENEPPEIEIEVVEHDEQRKIAGLEARRATMRMRVLTRDVESGEEVTYKVVYDAWLTEAFDGREEMEAFAAAYAEALGFDMRSGSVMNMAGAIASAGVSLEDFADEAAKLDGYPLEATITFGVELTEEQRAELAAQQEEPEEEEKSSGGFGGFGGFGDKLKKSVGDKLAQSLATSLFGEGVTEDEDGDPVFVRMLTEVDKISTKSVDDKRFQIPDDYDPAG